MAVNLRELNSVTSIKIQADFNVIINDFMALVDINSAIYIYYIGLLLLMNIHRA